MPFRSKESIANKTKSLRTGLFSDTSKQQQRVYHQEYNHLVRHDGDSCDNGSAPIIPDQSKNNFPAFMSMSIHMHPAPFSLIS